MQWPREAERQRVVWWLVGLFLLLVVGRFALHFVGTFVFGLFVYYGARPIHERVEDAVGHRGAAATLTLLAIVVPGLALLGYVGLVAIRELTIALDPGLLAAVGERSSTPDAVRRLIRDPRGYLTSLDNFGAIREQLTAGLRQLGVLTNGLVHLTLALSMSFFLLRDGDRIDAWFREEIGGDGSVPHAYVSAVDADLQTVYFGNVITVSLVTVLAVVVYNGYNAVVPSAVAIPFPTLLALLTGVATFVPLVVGKLVYVPVTGYLVWLASQDGAGLLWAPLSFLVVAFVFLDLLPQAVLRPIISGRSLHTGLVLFAYVLGAAYFGWYGLFLGPLLVVLAVQFLNVVVPELIHGEPLSPAPSAALGLGHDPEDGVDDAAASDDESAGEEAGDQKAE
ncbi:AI-2E family transporter [Halolamina sp. C58]|uniref:AI-2E family transporter n=1 Tax=Halolamina sp. C58 TaxID=3421640 RepID=UPI003EBB6AB1